MNTSKSTGKSSPDARAGGVIQRFWRWWRPRSMAEQYLSTATDLADLERRMRELERAKDGPVFVTFNH